MDINDLLKRPFIKHPTYRFNGSMEAHVVKILFQGDNRPQTIDELFESTFGAAQTWNDKLKALVQAAVNTLLDEEHVEDTRESELFAHTYRLSEEFFKELYSSDTPGLILEVSLMVKGVEIPAQRLREFWEHTRHTVEGTADDTQFSLYQGIVLTKPEARALIRALNASYLF